MSRGEFGYGSTNERGRGSPRGRNDTSGFGSGYQRLGGQSFKDLVDEISSNIFTINGNATTIEKSVKLIGTQSDSVKLRDKIHKTEQNTNGIISATARALKDLSSVCNRSNNRQEKLQYQRLTNEFKDAARRYNDLQRKVAERVKSTAPLPSQQQQPTQGEGASALIDWGDIKIQNEEEEREEQQKKIQMQQQTDEVEAEVAMLQEREERIRQLEGDILDINEIFRDLGTLVHEQGEVIDSIENNVETAHDHVEAGRDELKTAARYQRKARKKMCILIIVLLIIAAIVALIIYLSVKK